MTAEYVFRTLKQIILTLTWRIAALEGGTGGGSSITALTGDVTATGPGSATATIANDAVTYAKIQNVSAASRLLGRGSASGAGDVQEISLGSGLSMSGTTLDATGGSGTVTTTGSPSSGNLTKFSGATSITNGDLSGDVTTSGTLATTLANSGVSAGTYGNSTNVAQVTVDAKGRVTAASDVAISGISGTAGGGLILIEKKLFTSDSQNYTFSGLDGNTDEVYFLTGRIKNNAGAAVYYEWKPNNLTSNQNSEFSADDGGGVGNLAGGLCLSRTDSAKPINGSYVQFHINIFAKKNPNGQSFILTYDGQTTNWDGTTFKNQGHIDGVWSETSTNLTSIVVNASAAAGIANGSTLALYKYAQS